MAATAALIRTETLKRRRSHSAEDISRLSHLVIQRFMTFIQAPDWAGRRVGMYRAMPGELSLLELEGWLIQAGAVLHFPRVVKKGEIEFAAMLPHAGVKWDIGSYGIEEPPAAIKSVQPTTLDVIFVPGVAFGQKGERIGMGMGFYDRYLVQAPQALRIALTFEFQLFPELEQNSWDQRVDWIITEKSAIRIEGRPR